MYLVFDVETSGLPNYKLPIDHETQPHIVQIAMMQIGDKASGYALQQSFNFIIKHDNYEIPVEASNIHGITTERANKYGIPLASAMSVMGQLCGQSKYLICHNIRFDTFLVRTALNRLGYNDFIPRMKQYCTMEKTRDIVCMPPTAKMVTCGITCHKSPKLEEAFEWFFGYVFDGAHDALEDVKATVDVFKAVQHYGKMKALEDRDKT